VNKLMKLVDDKNPSRDCHHRIDDVEGQFSVKSAYFILYITKQRENSSIFKALWNLNIISKAKRFE